MTDGKVFVGFDYCVAPWWKRVLARVFGRRVTAKDGCCKVVGHYFNGKLYISESQGEE